MKCKINTQRRQFLQYSSITAAATSFPTILNATSPGVVNKANTNFHPDVEIELTMDVARISILDGPKTKVWKVFGKVLKGSNNSVENLAGTYLAPTLNFYSGQKVRIFLKNNLPAQSILHWHGLHVPSNMDGNPMYAINHGETYVYEFKILNRAGTYWYHSHAHGVTAKQVYSGLAGFIIVKDKQEQALNLPKGKYDLPLVIQDRSFDNNNQLSYSNHMMQRMQGFLGNQILVNGRPNFILPVETRSYRLRILNGSNSRIYKLVWDDGSPITIIGNDGGLIERPEKMAYAMLAPAERLEIWVDFSNKAIGKELSLRSIAFESASMHGGMMGGMGGGMMGRRSNMMGGRGRGMSSMMSSTSLPAGSDYPILKVKVVKQSRNNDPLPTRLTPINPLRLQDAANADTPKSIRLSMRHMSALLNGRSYKMNDVRSDEVIPVNSLQVLTLDNGFDRRHEMMSMPHPMHLHGEQFQVLKREVNYFSQRSYSTVSNGFMDKGWKDTILIMPGEKVTILKPFNDFKGLFMYHCHNLEHEDMGMMRDFLVK